MGFWRFAAGVVLLMGTCDIQATTLDISGFGSFIGGRNDSDIEHINYQSKSIDYEPDSLVGLQVSGQINDKATATVQLIASAIDGWNISADWAYIRYQPRSDFSWKIGRLRAPFFFYSEDINVGYSFPWITAPYTVYIIPFHSVDGVTANYSVSSHSVDFDFQVYSGGARSSLTSGVLEDAKIDTRDQFGVILQATWKSWIARTGLHQTNLSMDFSGLEQGAQYDALINGLRNAGYEKVAENLQLNNDKSNFADVALQYDDGKFFGVIESTYFTSYDKTPISNILNYYVSAGIRQDKMQYVLTYEHSMAEDPDIKDGLPTNSIYYALADLAIAEFKPGVTRSMTAGLRWDFADRMAFKFETLYIPDASPLLSDGKKNIDMTIMRMGIQTIF